MAVFLANEVLKAYQRSGRLELVLWDHHGECAGPAHMRCWQPLVYSHAILQAWGSGLRLVMIDIDEYFVLPQANSTLAGALQGNCTGGQPMVRPAAHGPAHSRRAARPDSSAEARGGADICGSSKQLLQADFSDLTDVTGCICTAGRGCAHAQVVVRRYDVYLGPAASRALPAGAAETSLWRPDERAARPAPHPLSLYSLQAPQPDLHGKSMVDPEHVATFEARSRSHPP
jgi:hypothetical protein